MKNRIIILLILLIIILYIPIQQKSQVWAYTPPIPIKNKTNNVITLMTELPVTQANPPIIQTIIVTQTPTKIPQNTYQIYTNPMQEGQYLASSYGWTGYEWDDLVSLWTRESGWNPYAYNPSSGACGIPQALPCSKIGDMSVIGQIKWGLEYIQGRYGDPASAWNHEINYGWY